jgi:hypothetical protein
MWLKAKTVGKLKHGIKSLLILCKIVVPLSSDNYPVPGKIPPPPSINNQ